MNDLDLEKQLSRMRDYFAETTCPDCSGAEADCCCEPSLEQPWIAREYERYCDD